MAIPGPGVPYTKPYRLPFCGDSEEGGNVDRRVAELPILLSVFSDTDVATVLRAERELNLSGRVAP